MHIPFDRLYDFLHGVVNHDVIMYRWYPNGSKKLEDLIPYGPNKVLSWFDAHTTPVAIYHDQEPLNFDLYSSEALHKFYLEMSKARSPLSPDSKFLQQRVDAHLRGLFLYNGYDLTILCHSEQRSKELEKYQNKGFVGVYYWSHALIAKDWYRYAEYDTLLDRPLNGPLFLVNNRAWSGSREYRLKFIELVVNNQLALDCLTRFNSVDGDNDYKNHRFVNSDFQISRFDFEQVFELNMSTSDSSGDYSVDDYRRTQIEIVLETLFDDSRIHLTEKSLRPIACGKPFILAATAGSLEYLRSYGFETFSPWINEEYDTIKDPTKRLQAIVCEMNRIKNLPEDQRRQLLYNVNAIAKRNKQLFFSDSWSQKIVDEYKQNFDYALETVKRSNHGSHYKKLGELLEIEESPLKKFYNQAQPGLRTQDEMNKFLDWINGRSPL